MRTVTTYTNIYTFDELSDEAKERVRADYLDDEFRAEIFTEDCLNRLYELFPTSNLKVEYSLASCQGDGLNIYGEIYFKDLIEVLKDKFSEKEIRFLQWAFKETGIDSYVMEKNKYYTYCIAHTYNFTEDIEDALYFYNMKNVKTDVLNKLDKEAKLFFENLCKELEDYGYDFLYTVSDEELEEWANDNDYEFTEDGSIF